MLDYELPEGCCPLEGTVKLDNFGTVEIVQVIGKGSACLCYAVRVMEQNSEIRHRMILKEFYPAMLPSEQIKRDGNCLKLNFVSEDEKTEVQKLLDGWEQAYHLQSALENEDEMMGVIVKPHRMYVPEENADFTRFALYEANWGDSLEKIEQPELGELLLIVQKTADALARLHKKNVLLMDMKPANLLYVDRGTATAAVKLFDFDASLCLDKEHIRAATIRYSDLRLLAPELRHTDHWRMYLCPAVDVYALGAILFHALLGRYPEKTDTEESVQKELYRCFQYKYRKQMTERQQEMLLRILRNSTAWWQANRYSSAEKMAEDMQALLNSLNGERFEQTRVGEVSYSMLSAGILDRHPLYKYSTDEDGKRSLDAVIVGCSPMRDAFLENIFACCQMLDSTLNIHIIGTDCENYICELLERCPSLGKTAYIYLNDKEYTEKSQDIHIAHYQPQDNSITTQKLANLYFYQAKTNSAQTFERVLKDRWKHLRYFLLTAADSERNYQLAAQLAEIKQNQTVFVGYCDDRGDGYDLREILPVDVGEQFLYEPIGMDANYSENEKCFDAEVTARALEVHKSYAGITETDDRAKAEFLGNSAYNKRSSIRSALSIPYEVKSVGIEPHQAQAGTKFEQQILSGEGAAEEQLNRLLWLEHRSWCAFMVMDGARRPTMEQLYTYAFRNGNDQKHKSEKLHPCLCESRDKGIELQLLDAEEWLTCDETKYDELDRMSLLLHRHCRERTERLDLENYFLLLKTRAAGMPAQPLTAKLSEKYHALLSGDRRGWTQFCDHLQTVLKGEVIPLKLLACIREETAVAAEYVRRHDYKASDLDILKAIPQILQ